MKQPDILIIGVIYNTFTETLRYLESIAGTSAGNVALVLADNSSKPKPAGFTEKIGEYPFAQYFETGSNLGYFGGAREGLKRYLAGNPDYPKWILVTNVDIRFTGGFFNRLQTTPGYENLGLIAPAIISDRWGRDYNPKRRKRFSATRLHFYLLLYSCFLLHNVYLVGSYLKSWVLGLQRRTISSPESLRKTGKKIYAAHGSCLVFKDTYFRLGGTLDLPNFLFGEEIFVAETAARLGLDVIYDPRFVIHDHEHASVGIFITPKINKYYRESIQTILRQYYR